VKEEEAGLILDVTVLLTMIIIQQLLHILQPWDRPRRP
jgi:hypothetical protein